ILRRPAVRAGDELPFTAGGGQCGHAGNLLRPHAFVVVSHDERFLARIGVDRWLRLADGELTETGAPEEE
ncbi:hypothetical protein ACWDR0_15920, partial [Streptomyces sp. NPDC003691]